MWPRSSKLGYPRRRLRRHKGSPCSRNGKCKRSWLAWPEANRCSGSLGRSRSIRRPCERGGPEGAGGRGGPGPERPSSTPRGRGCGPGLRKSTTTAPCSGARSWGSAMGGPVAQVHRFVRPLRVAARQVRQATMRFETPPGQQAQVDFGQRRVWIGEHYVAAHLFGFTLGYSRRLYAAAFPHERLDVCWPATSKPSSIPVGCRCKSWSITRSRSCSSAPGTARSGIPSPPTSPPPKASRPGPTGPTGPRRRARSRRTSAT